MRNILLLIVAGCGFLIGCANTTTSKYSFKDSTGRVGSIELPKDIQAEGLDIKTSTGARIKIKKLVAVGSPEQTAAQGKRESDNLAATAKPIEAVGSAVGAGAATFIKKSVGMP